MIHNDLTKLDSQEIHELSISISSPETLHDRLERTEAVKNVRDRINQCSLVFEEIHETVSEWLSNMKRGVRFSHESALSALAVVLETQPGRDAEKFLEDLSGLKIMEIPMASRVAQVSLQRRQNLINDVTYASKKFDAVTVADDPREVKPLWILSETTIDSYDRLVA